MDIRLYSMAPRAPWCTRHQLGYRLGILLFVTHAFSERTINRYLGDDRRPGPKICSQSPLRPYTKPLRSSTSCFPLATSHFLLPASRFLFRTCHSLLPIKTRFISNCRVLRRPQRLLVVLAGSAGPCSSTYMAASVVSVRGGCSLIVRFHARSTPCDQRWDR